jgi:hypothetical protein
MNYPNDPHPDYHKMVRKLEREGMTTSDAQGVADVHYAKKAKSTALKGKKEIKHHGKYSSGLSEVAVKAMKASKLEVD